MGVLSVHQPLPIASRRMGCPASTVARASYALLWARRGRNMPTPGLRSRIRTGMVFTTAAELQEAKSVGAVEPGLQTLGKLERFIKSR